MSEDSKPARKAKYNDLSHDELVSLLAARDRRDATRLGLVWEANEIERDKAINNDFVVLDLDRSLCVGEGPWRNLLIEGDNFDALRYLRMTLAGRVKCILIDPPYNTGNDDFIYNDKFVDKEHLWRHSMWLEFVYQRLVVARDLLREDGVIFVHIGEDEVNRLGCLMDRVFPGRKVGTFVWRTRSGANDSKAYFRSIDHEYVLCYANSDFTFAGKKKDKSLFANPDNDPNGPWCNDNLVKAHNYRQRENTFYPIHDVSAGIWYACDPDNVWRFASESKLLESQRARLRKSTMEEMIHQHKVLWPKNTATVAYTSVAEIKRAIVDGTAPRNLRIGNTDDEKTFWDKELAFWVGKTIGYGKPRYKRHLSEVKRDEKPFSTWLMPASTKKEERAEIDTADVRVIEVGHTSDGTSLLQEILGNKDFPYPKPLSLVQGLLQQVTSDDDIVLDFFAGSGTTGHAVLALNEVDGGDRRFILVSSTEATVDEPSKNVCRDTCQRRLARVIGGYTVATRNGSKDVPGIVGDVAYLRCARLAPGRLTGIDHAQVWTALQLMHRDVLGEYKGDSILHAGDEDEMLIYIPRFRKGDGPALRQLVKSSRAVVVYSWQPELIRQQLQAENHMQIESIPEALSRRFGMKA